MSTGFEFFHQSLASTVQPDRERRARTPERLRCFSRVEPLPRPQGDRLAFGGRQPRQRVQHRVARHDLLRRIARRRSDHARLCPHLGVEPGAARDRPSMVGEDLPSDPEQPGQRLWRDRLEPPPSDEIRLRDDVPRRLTISAPKRVGEDPPGRRSVEAFEAGRPIPIQMPPLELGSEDMSGHGSVLSPRTGKVQPRDSIMKPITAQRNSTAPV